LETFFSKSGELEPFFPWKIHTSKSYFSLITSGVGLFLTFMKNLQFFGFEKKIRMVQVPHKNGTWNPVLAPRKNLILVLIPVPDIIGIENPNLVSIPIPEPILKIRPNSSFRANSENQTQFQSQNQF
jgi:hypothetical protein